MHRNNYGGKLMNRYGLIKQKGKNIWQTCKTESRINSIGATESGVTVCFKVRIFQIFS